MALHHPDNSPSLGLADRLDLLFYALIGAMCVLQVALCCKVERFGDGSSYYIDFAHSLARHGGFVFNFQSYTRFPPGMPVVLAGIERVFGGGFTVFVRFMPVFGALGLLVFYHVVRREENRGVAAAGCFLLGFSPYFFGMATQDVFSDLPYMAASALALLLAIHAERAKSGRMRWAAGFGFAVALSVALMIRSAGIALLFGLAAWLLSSFLFSRRREVAWRRLRVFLPALILGIAAQASWWAWQSKVRVPDWRGKQTSSYMGQLLLKDAHRPEAGPLRLTDVPVRVAQGLRNLGAHMSELATGAKWVAPLWYSPLVLLPILLVGTGLCGSVLRNEGHYLEWYVFAYIFMYVLWPFDKGARFIAPVFPALFLYLWRGGRWLAIWGWLTLPWSLDCACLGSLVLFVSSSFSARYSATQPGLQGRLAVIGWASLAVASLLLRWTQSKWRSWLSPAGGQAA